MSTQLRQAAEKLRAKADDAVLATGDARWHFTGPSYCVDRQASTYSVWSVGAPHAPDPDAVFVCDAATEEQAEYIATMQPTVALAVADWLDEVARQKDVGGAVDTRTTSRALTVARAVLGETS